MERVKFKNENQGDFLKKLKFSSNLSTEELANLCLVSSRTFRDWLRGKYSISENALKILSEKLSFSLPEDIEIIDDYWYVSKGARKGALRRLELYGHLGTAEGRKKGGVISQLRRKENPEKYRLLGCNIRKEFRIDKPTTAFAEVAGIILGDGAITDYQVRVTLSNLVDQPYALFVKSLFSKVFLEEPSLSSRLQENVINLSLSGIGLVEELERWKFRRGNKVRNQIDFPIWVWRKVAFQKACVRGLMDTDGGCYFHKHKVNGLIYRNFGICFANESLPIVQSMAKVLKSLNIKFSITRKGTRIYIYSFEEIKKYFSVIGTNNPKNMEKFRYYSAQKSHRIIL